MGTWQKSKSGQSSSLEPDKIRVKSTARQELGGGYLGLFGYVSGSQASLCTRITWRARKTDRWALLPKFPVDLGRGLKICISNKLPCEAAAAGPGATL